MTQELCPCGSGDAYETCCQPFHRGESIPSNALALMRLRYSAYAKGLCDYIIKTTHAGNPVYQKNQREWAKEIVHFSQKTKFEKLEILEFIDGNEKAFVTFAAVLMQDNRDVSFIEKSCFVKDNNRWLYLTGEIHPYASHDSRESQDSPSIEGDPDSKTKPRTNTH